MKKLIIIIAFAISIGTMTSCMVDQNGYLLPLNIQWGFRGNAQWAWNNGWNTWDSWSYNHPVYGWGNVYQQQYNNGWGYVYTPQGYNPCGNNCYDLRWQRDEWYQFGGNQRYPMRIFGW